MSRTAHTTRNETRTETSRRVVLRASRTRFLFTRAAAALSDRAVLLLNVVAFLSLAAALLALLLL